jgi:hypothetical protein
MHTCAKTPVLFYLIGRVILVGGFVLNAQSRFCTHV